jgi:hypothetical protein
MDEQDARHEEAVETASAVAAAVPTAVLRAPATLRAVCDAGPAMIDWSSVQALTFDCS